MGRWNRHPMGSDGALDAQDALFRKIYGRCEKDSIAFWGRKGQELLKEYLQTLSLEELQDIIEEDEWLNKNRFVIPYTYLQYDINRPELRGFLIRSLNYHEDITGRWNYCSDVDENGEVHELKHIRIFKENFDDVFAWKLTIPTDKGLLATIFYNDLEQETFKNKL